MADLKTTYLGLSFKNPLLVASCSLSKSVDGIRKIADAGAGGAVIKSLFEEQIDRETRELEAQIGSSWHTEARDYVRNMGMELGPNAYLKLVEKARKAVSIPLIASLNCVTPRWWTEYACKLENAGADALELNIAYLPVDARKSGAEVESLYLDILDSVKGILKIPVAVKIGPHFSSLAHFSKSLAEHGAKALVLFNRFYQPDIDINGMKLSPGYTFSGPAEMALPLRWIALLSGRISCEFSATTGIHEGADIIKCLLAGARTVQVGSALYEKGLKHIRTMLGAVEAWMVQKNFTSVEGFRGLLSKKGEAPELWERLQYIQALVGIE